MNGGKILKVAGILMIIGGALGIIFGILAIAGINALSDLGVDKTLLLVSSIFAIVAGIIELFAGIKGVKSSTDPAQASKCIIWGIVVVACSIIAQIINVAGGGAFSASSLVTGLILPAAYIYGAFMMKKSV